jgi:hypothetical protein
MHKQTLPLKVIIAAACLAVTALSAPTVSATDKPAAQCLIANMKDVPDARQGNAVMVGPCVVSSQGAVPPEQDFGWSGYEKATAKTPREIYQFSTADGLQCLGVDLTKPMSASSGKNNGYGVSLFPTCKGKLTQKWFEDKGMVKIELKINGKKKPYCLEAKTGVTPGAATTAKGGSFAIVVPKCTGKPNQLWRLSHVIEGL